MKWSEIKDETYELMFIEDFERADYDSAIINAANYALVDLSESVSPVVVCEEIIMTVPKNLIDKRHRKPLYVVEYPSPITFNVSNLGSLAFKYSGEGQMNLTYRGIKQEYILPNTENMSEYSVVLSERENTVVEFISDNRLVIKNLGLYSEMAEDVSSYEEYMRIDLNELSMGQFLRLSENGGVFDKNTGDIFTDWYFIKPDTVYVRTDYEGIICISYIKYPNLITKYTSPNTELEISYEAAKLIPLYAAYRLLKDDNERLAVIYYNEFTERKSDLMSRNALKDVYKVNIWSDRGRM